MAVPEAFRALVEKFEFQRPTLARSQYNETQLRREFIDKFFAALGWDVDNNKGFSEAYKEVLHEEPVRIRGTTQFFDYTFRIGGVRKFIVETKKPSVRIKDDADSALQLRWYAWNAKLPLSILTNFEEFAVYDCTRKPATSDAAAVARIEYFTYKDYPEKWDWISSVFAQESILRGSFDKYAESTKGKKGTAGVDDDILAEIEEWRDALAKNIALRNTLTVEELNSVVQRTIDRIIFLRICEDRGVGEYGTLAKLLDGEHVYERLCDHFRTADAKYNSGLFHFQQEPDWDELPDTLSLRLVIDDKVLKAIIRRLYYPESPYIFSIIPPAILGHVYEQFLGKVIRLTEGGHAKVEYKPEVKKAGGVFYTPQYIVEYIVKHTVGELVKEKVGDLVRYKTPRDVAKLRILDPACGSGSFLIGAYQFLLNWHRDWYIANLVPVFLDKKSITDPAVQALMPKPAPNAKKKTATQIDLPIYKVANGDPSKVRSDWRLTTAEKKRILLNNIYGVDIDQQAVEVTKLSLLLKVLEEENEENISKQLKLFAERALPSLHQNIKCGNSLIGTEIYADVQATLDQSEARRINAFNWDNEFADVMKVGGFDAVIGNPPYVRQETLGQEFKDYAKKHYETYAGTADLYVYFFEKGHDLLRNEGYFGIICSNKFMKAKYGANLREFLATKSRLVQIIDFGELPVFQNASTFPAIFVTKKSNISEQHFDYVPIKRLSFSSLDDEVKNCKTTLTHQALAGENWTLTNEKEITIIEKMRQNGKRLEEYTNGKIFRGIITGLNEAFVIDNKTKDKLVNENSISSTLIKPFIIGDNVRRYRTLIKEKNVILMPKSWTNALSGDAKNKWNWLKENYPAISRHLEPFSEAAEKRLDKGNYWWELRACEYYSSFEKPKIIFPNICKEPRFTFDNSNFYSNQKTYIIPIDDKYLLGLLNSKLIWLFLKRTCTCLGDPDKGGRLELSYIYVREIPLRTINFSDPADKARHDRMVALVTQMLDLNKKLQDAKLEHEKTVLSRQIEATDAAIDKLVYELYGLTEEEIKVVEGTP